MSKLTHLNSISLLCQSLQIRIRLLPREQNGALREQGGHRTAFLWTREGTHS